MTKHKKGFTLVELIIVIAVIAVIAAAVFVAIDPARRLHEARNGRRASDITNMLDAIVKYQADNQGVHYSAVSAIPAGSYVIIGTTADDDGLCTAEANAADACANVVSGVGTADCADLSAIGTNYLATVPYDPGEGSAADASYYISRNANNSITVGACDEEGEDAGGGGTPPTIEFTR